MRALLPWNALFLALGTVLVTVNPSLAQENLRTISQRGPLHVASVEQVGTENVATILQGTRLPAVSHEAVIDQVGDRNVATIEQTQGLRWFASIRQAGGDNESSILQQGKLGRHNAVTDQTGNSNRAEQIQSIALKGEGAASVVQTGNRNVASQSQQAGFAHHVTVGILQLGNRNEAHQVQTAEHRTRKTNSTTLIHQEGNRNFARQEQAGRGGHFAYVIQKGNENSAVVSQTGTDHHAKVTQTGAGHVAEVVQSGKSNRARITQTTH